ncbi:MAG: hypothetical protein LAQ69_43515 [Acidobacteriia bacterium]|nr:hypothetical protein [Terriglobia bacterium]
MLALVLLIRIPFWNQAIQGDDTIYLHEAAHALVEPLHPDNTKYVFQGALVDLRGHPHAPMDAWVLAGLIAAIGDVKEIPFHAAYTVFSLIAAWAMWSLARRFSPAPLWATLLFIAVPVFVVNGNSLETDLPFLAFWMAAVALFQRHTPVACVFLALAAMTSPQAIALTPILGVYVWLYRRHDRGAWLAIFVPPITLVAWQLFERLSTGALPAGVLSGYLTRFDIWNPQARLALLIHACFLIFPALLPGAFAIAWRKRREPDTLFLLAWIGLFFAGALVVFFAGSARYLLPIAAPLALLVSRLKPKWLAIGFAAQMTLGLGLAMANYQHWDGYRRLASSLREITARQRVWVDDEWGLRHYMHAEGALPLTKTQRLRVGDIVVASELSHQVELTAPVLPFAKTTEIRPAIPLRLIGLETHSGYSTVSKGIWPFGISSGPVDRVRVVEVGERHPTLEYLTMSGPGVREHVVSGIWPDDHWMSGSGFVVLKSPTTPMPLSVTIYIPDNAPARRVSLLLDGQEVASQTFAAPGKYDLASTGAVQPAGTAATVEIRVDRTFTAAPDIRELGVVVIGVGFHP